MEGGWGKWEVAEVLPPVPRRGSRAEVPKGRTGAQRPRESAVGKDVPGPGCSLG